MRKTTALLVLAALLPTTARAAEPDDRPYQVDVTVVRDGRSSTARIEAAPGETGSATARREIPYRQVASADPDAEGVPAPTIDLARTVTVTPVERDGVLHVTARVSVSDLVGLDRHEEGGRSVDLPDVRTLSLGVEDRAMTRVGEGWSYEETLPAQGATIRIVATR